MVGRRAGALPDSGRGPGRPRGVTEKLSRVRAHELVKTGNAPLDIMLQNMMFWHNSACDLSKRIDEFVVNVEDPGERREMYGLLRSYLAARENSQRCAVDAAPYVHPRLQSIAIKQEADEKRVAVTMTLPPTAEAEDRLYRDDELGDGNKVVSITKRA